MAAQLRAVEETLLGLAPLLVPERLATHQLSGVLRSLGRIERCAGGARIVLAKAGAETDQWKRDGARSAAEWAAKQNGSTVGEAKADLEASAQLANLPAARNAAASGKLSKEATKAVAAGATADPTAESSLLDKGAAGDLAAVREEARRARQRRDERNGRAAQRMYERRQLRTWIEVDGEGRGQWNVPPSYQAAFFAALEPYRRAAFQQARAAGQRPSHEALMADALQMLCLDVLGDLDLPIPEAARTNGHHETGSLGESATAAGPDHRRGTPPAGPFDTQPGRSSSAADAPEAGSDGGADERPACAGEGSGASRSDRPAQPSSLFDQPDPPSRSNGCDDGSHTGHRPSAHVDRGTGPTKQPRRHRRAPAQISFHVDIAAWLRGHARGDEVCEIPGLGSVPVSLARALSADAVLKLILRNGDDVTTITSHRRYIPAALRSALESRDRTCVVPGCHATHNLEIDHIHEFGQQGPTELSNCCRLCKFHHYLKTHCHWSLRGPPGQWTFEPP